MILELKQNGNVSVHGSITEHDRTLGGILEEIIGRLQQAEMPNLDDYARRYPELAEQLADLLPSIAALVELGGSVAAPADSVGATGVVLKNEIFETITTGPDAALGGLRLLRQFGQVGMGIVYEAEQISLGRQSP